MAKKASSRKAARTGAKKAVRKTAKKAVKKVAKKASKKVTRKAASKVTKKTAKKAVKTAKKSVRGAKPKPPLTKLQLKKFRGLLMTKRKDLLGDMTGIESEALRKNRHGESGDLSSLPTHPADIGTDNYEQEFTLGLLESERALLGEIDFAIERIGRGTYGICLGTGESIGVARLKARPWSKYCIEYARQLEKGTVRRDTERESVLAGFAEDIEE